MEIYLLAIKIAQKLAEESLLEIPYVDYATVEHLEKLKQETINEAATIIQKILEEQHE